MAQPWSDDDAGAQAVLFGRSLGYRLDDWQEWVLRGMLSEDVTYRLCATLVVLIVPRQNGKNLILEVYELFCFYVLDTPVMIHSAHRADTSADHMLQIRKVVESHPDLEAITDIYTGNGKEKLVRKDTLAELRFVTRSKKIARGKSPQIVVLDEALYLTAEQLQAMIPSMAAQSMNEDMPMLIYTSSAPLAESLDLHKARATGRAGGGRVFYAEWGNEPDDIPDDLESDEATDRMYDANPGMGIRISHEWCMTVERPLMTRHGFLAERFGVAIGGVDEDGTFMPEWDDLADPESIMVTDPEIAVDVGPDGNVSIVAAAFRPDGLLHVELVAYMEEDKSTAAVVRKVAANTDRVWLLPRTESAGLLQALRRWRSRDGTRQLDVQQVGPLDYLQACLQWKRTVEERTIRHRDETPMNLAVRSATVKPSSEGWVWARKTSLVDISPLVAGSIACWAVGEPIEDEGDPNLW